MEITVDTAGQEDRMFMGLALNPPYSGPARDGSVFNVGDPVIVVDLTEDDVDDYVCLIERKGKVTDVEDDPFPVRVGFTDVRAGNLEYPSMWFKDAELMVDEAALLKADEAAQREYVA